MQQTNGQIFVYGSLRSGFQHPAYAYISRYFALVSENARVKGILYDMGDYPAAVPADEEFFIQGELYRIHRPDEFAYAIAQLDDYEGVQGEPGEPVLYRREITTVYTIEATTTAWIYWFNGPVEGGQRLESGDVLEYRERKNKQ